MKEGLKETAIRVVVDTAITSFAEGLVTRYTNEHDNPEGVINSKKNNCFIAELGKEFMFYSAFVRSFDSSFGNVLEKMGNNIAKLSYEVRGNINSYILPEQIQRIANILNNYLLHEEPETEHYNTFTTIKPKIIESYRCSHVTDNYFYDKERDMHYFIELKASGDLDNKKARAEKDSLLQQYFMLKNLLISENKPSNNIKIFFGTAYNKYGEGNEWKQARVRQFFSKDELLIGKDYWNFVCDDSGGFDIIFSQYKLSCENIRKALIIIKDMYF